MFFDRYTFFKVFLIKQAGFWFVFCPQEILKQQSLRMFELVQKHPPHWPPFIPPTKPEVTTTGAGVVPLKVLLGTGESSQVE